MIGISEVNSPGHWPKVCQRTSRSCLHPFLPHVSPRDWVTLALSLTIQCRESLRGHWVVSDYMHTCFLSSPKTCSSLSSRSVARKRHVGARSLLLSSPTLRVRATEDLQGVVSVQVGCPQPYGPPRLPGATRDYQGPHESHGFLVI